MVHKKKNDGDTEVVTHSDEITSDELEIEEIESKTSDKLRTLRDSLKHCETEKTQFLEDLQRARADFLNSRRRIEEQSSRDRERVTEGIIKDLLPLIDSLDALMGKKDSWTSTSGEWGAGIVAIHGQLIDFLKRQQVTEVEALGTPFNPHEHDAISQETVTDPLERDTVVSVLQKGYKRNDAIIRASKVIVGTA